MSYKILEIPPNLERPYSEMSKQGAVAFFEWLNRNYQSRIDELALFVNETDGTIQLDYSPESLSSLGDWLQRVLRVREKSEEEIETLVLSVPAWLKESVRGQDKELSEESLSIVFDLAIYFSLVLMKNNEGINWSMKTKASKFDANRNQLVLTGVTKLDVNPIRSIENICFGIATGKKEPERLRAFFAICRSKLLNL